MKSGGYFILGGLLQGVGKGLEQDYQNKRQMALLALKRQYDVQDAATAHEYKLDETAAETEAKKGLLGVTGEQNRQTEEVKGAQDRLTEAAKNTNTQANIVLKGNIDLTHDQKIEAIKHDYNLDEITARSLADTQHDLKLAHITPDHYEVSANGQIIIYKKDGTAFVRGRAGDFVPRGSSDDDGGASITGEMGNRGRPTKRAGCWSACRWPTIFKAHSTMRSAVDRRKTR
jgi:hypothetical protein